MKLNHIVRDSSTDLFYIDNTSITNSYPKLKLNSSTVNTVIEEVLYSLEYYKGKNFNKFLQFSNLREIVDFFETNQVHTKVSTRIQAQVDLLKTYLTVDGEKSKYEKPDNTLTESEKTILINKADELGMSDEILGGFSLRENTSYVGSEKKTFNVQTVEKFNPREDITYKDIYTSLEILNSIWEKIVETTKDSEVIELDSSITYGNSLPLYSSIPFSPDYKRLSGTIIYKEIGDDNIYKDSFSIEAEETSVLNLESLQVLWVSPKTKNSLVKLVWDYEVIEEAFISNLKASKT